MKLIILGSGTCVPSATRKSSGYYLETNDVKLILDSGSGAMHAMASNDIDFYEIDAFFYSHMHIDHIADLPSLLSYFHQPLCLREKKLTIYGPPGLNKIVTGFKEIFGEWVEPRNFEINFQEINNGDTITINNTTILAQAVYHFENSFGYRVTDSSEKVFAYSGDSGTCDSLVELARSADLAVFEAAVPEEAYEEMQLHMHMTPTIAGTLAQEAGVKKLVLSHIYPPTDQCPILERAQKVFDKELVVAQDNMSFEI